MEVAALSYTIGFFEGKNLAFKKNKILSHDRVGNRLVLTATDGAIHSINIDKYDYTLYPDYKAAKEVKTKLLSQLRSEITVPAAPAKVEETPQNASGI